MKDRLIYLAADPTGSDNVGAFLKDAAGAHITSTLISGKQALDVNVVSNADDGIYAEDTASADGHFGSSVLAVRQDALAVSTSTDGDYGDFKTNNRGALWVAPVGNVDDDAADAEFPVKIGARADSVLSAVADADRVNVVSDLFRRVRVNDSPDINVQQNATSVDDTVGGVALPVSVLGGRKHMKIQNLSTQRDVYLGASGVTVADGYELRRGSSIEMPIGPNIALFAIADTGFTADVRTMQLA